MGPAIYYATAAEFESLREGLKQRACPFCRLTGRLNRHSMIYDEDGDIAGQRVYCNGRHGAPGCGHTFRLVRSECLVGFQIPLAVLWRYLQGLIAGKRKSEAFAASGCRLHPSAAYRLHRRLRERLLAIRSLLFRQMPVAHPPTVEGLVAQTLIHLAGHFSNAVLPLAQFQYAFQTPFL